MALVELPLGGWIESSAVVSIGASLHCRDEWAVKIVFKDGVSQRWIDPKVTMTELAADDMSEEISGIVQKANDKDRSEAFSSILSAHLAHDPKELHAALVTRDVATEQCEEARREAEKWRDTFWVTSADPPLTKSEARRKCRLPWEKVTA